MAGVPSARAFKFPFLYVSVSAGGNDTLAVMSDGTLWAWGYNIFGELGDGTTTNRGAPVLIGADYVSVEAGSLHSFAFQADGTLWAWGYNAYGQLGDGTTVDAHAPAGLP